MGMQSCKECGEKVSDKAKECPHCGVSEPTTTLRHKVGAGVLTVIMLGGIGGYLFGDDPDKNTTGSSGDSEQDKANANENPCVSNWRKCDDTSDLVENNDHIKMARQRCESAAARQANYGEPEFPFFSFTSYYSDEKAIEKGKVTLLEDQAKFENQYGAMAKVEARCIYDLESKSVVSFDINRP